MKKKCAICGEEVSVTKGLKGLNLGSVVCNECWVKKTGIPVPKYVMDEFGEVEISKFKAVTQEKAVAVCCTNGCGQKVHTVGDVVIFVDCSVKSKERSGDYYKAFYVLPPKKYWCPLEVQK